MNQKEEITGLSHRMEYAFHYGDVKSEKMTFTRYFNIGSEDIEIEFDFVVQDCNKEIVCLGKYFPDCEHEEMADKQMDDYLEKTSVVEKYPVFYVTAGGDYVFVGENFRKVLKVDVCLLEREFVEDLKRLHPELKTPKDREFDKLSEELIDLKKVKEDQEKEIKQLLLEQERVSDYCEREVGELKTKLQEVKTVDKQRVQQELDNCIYLDKLHSAIDKIELPEKRERETTTPYGRGANEFTRSVDTVYNNSFKTFLTKLGDGWYLSVDIYDWYAKNQVDIPGEVFSESLYFKFDTKSSSFKSCKSVEAITWVGTEKE